MNEWINTKKKHLMFPYKKSPFPSPLSSLFFFITSSWLAPINHFMTLYPYWILGMMGPSRLLSSNRPAKSPILPLSSPIIVHHDQSQKVSLSIGGGGETKGEESSYSSFHSPPHHQIMPKIMPVLKIHAWLDWVRFCVARWNVVYGGY